jgi:hypothetical protein
MLLCMIHGCLGSLDLLGALYREWTRKALSSSRRQRVRQRQRGHLMLKAAVACQLLLCKIWGWTGLLTQEWCLPW